MTSLSRYRDETGTALVEFALVLPLILAIFLGMLDFGRAINYWIDGTHIANVAARYVTVNKNPGASRGLSLQEHMAAGANTAEMRDGSEQVIRRAEVCVTYPEGETVGAPVTVTVTVTYQWLGFLTDWSGIAPTSTLRGSATMRLEARPTNVPAGCQFAPATTPVA